MSESEKLLAYIAKNWPSKIKKEWQVGLEKYPEIVGRVLEDWTRGASRNRELVRIAGQSGSGKTSQLLPAVTKYFEKHEKNPVLIAARRFVDYHPYRDEIIREYGEKNLRKNTDDFATIMLFLTIRELMKMGYDIVLDVGLLNPEIEAILLKMIKENQYDAWMTMMAVAPGLTKKFLGKREWRHDEETEKEFEKSMQLAAEFYAEKCPEMHVVVWNAWELAPVYDGKMSGVPEVLVKYMSITDVPEHDEDELREAKIKYFENI